MTGEGYRLQPGCRFDPHTGLWRHASGPPGALLRLPEVSYGPDGEMTYPRRRAQAGEDAFPGYLREARALLAARPAAPAAGPTGLGPGFEALRWFPLPPVCLGSQPVGHLADAEAHPVPGPGPAR